MAMFDERDKDHDGLLSFEEFSGQETKMERAFKSMDKDGDGFITKAEFKLVCKNLSKSRGFLFSCDYFPNHPFIRGVAKEDLSRFTMPPSIIFLSHWLSQAYLLLGKFVERGEEKKII